VKVDVGLFDLMGARISVAFVDAAHIDSGADQLLAAIWERLRLLTDRPLMLYSNDGRGYGKFQTAQFANRIRREYALELLEIDLDKPFYEYLDDTPF
jgi:hypothetical protein